jgi:NAD(P)-dependent dehydrogenase (short-subunit alcohol dehydrogenase family)
MTTSTTPLVATPLRVTREAELVGQTVIVIGGSAGIGLETARRARGEGAEVVHRASSGSSRGGGA